MNTVTQWFCCTEKPAYAGEYEFRKKESEFDSSRPGAIYRCIWHGFYFSLARFPATDMHIIALNGDTAEQYEWRGVAK
jgi:hypothetical protein